MLYYNITQYNITNCNITILHNIILQYVILQGNKTTRYNENCYDWFRVLC